nr:EAL domain-containing protein [Actinomycetota bacterium]
MRALLRQPIVPFAGAVTGAGVFLVVVHAAATLPRLGELPWEFWLLAAFVVAGELLPIRVPRRSQVDKVTTSDTFAFAILLGWGAGPAVLALAVASVVDDVAARTPPRRAGFNLAQYALSAVAAGVVLDLLGVARLGADARISELEIPAIVLAAAVFFLVSYTLAGVAQALSEGLRPLPYLREDLLFQAGTAAMLLSLSPIVVVAATLNAYLVPFIVLPLLAVWLWSRQAALNEHQALHDALTGLPNRSLFRDRVAQAALAAERDGSPGAVALIELVGLREVNTALGHDQGDLLLKQLEPHLRAALRESDTVARLGGDEFALLLPDAGDAARVEVVARKVLRSLERPLPLHGLGIEVGATLGIACYPEHGRGVDALLEHAEVARHRAREAGERFAVYAPGLDDREPSRLELVSQLRRAIDRGELALVYQPKVEVATGAVRGVEVLVRWPHPERGMMPPAEFVPLAEHTGLIRPMTSFVLAEALRQCREWSRAGLEIGVAVNLPARGLADRDLPDEIAALLAAHELPPRRLTLEITESMLMSEPARAVAVLDRLNAMGVALSIDDFGTGYSSLTQLKRLPVAELKIDRSFVMGMSVDRDDAAIVRSTIDLGHNLGLEVVAEGVETEEIGRELAALGPDLVQGFALSRPVPGDDLPRWVAAQPDARRFERLRAEAKQPAGDGDAAGDAPGGAEAATAGPG